MEEEIKVGALPLADTLTGDEIVLIEQNDITKTAKIDVIKEIIIAGIETAIDEIKQQADIETQERKQAISTERSERIAADQYLQSQINSGSGGTGVAKAVFSFDSLEELEESWDTVPVGAIATYPTEGSPAGDPRTVTARIKLPSDSPFIFDEIAARSDKENISSDDFVGKIVTVAFDPIVKFGEAEAALWLAKKRYLPPHFQILKISDYQEYYDLFSVDSADNETALWLYNCNEDGSRNVDGEYFRNFDVRGLFLRMAGVNAVLKAANDTPYDGMPLGTVIGDAIRNFTGSFESVVPLYAVAPTEGAFRIIIPRSNALNYTPPSANNQYVYGYDFNPSRVVPTAHENRPGSISVNIYITY